MKIQITGLKKAKERANKYITSISPDTIAAKYLDSSLPRNYHVPAREYRPQPPPSLDELYLSREARWASVDDLFEKWKDDGILDEMREIISAGLKRNQ